VDTAFVWAEEGRVLLARREYAAAARSFAEARRRDPQAPLAVLEAYALFRSGRMTEARAAVAGLGREVPDVARLHDLMAATVGAAGTARAVQ
jgi:predicted Zn-dependent protease